MPLQVCTGGPQGPERAEVCRSGRAKDPEQRGVWGMAGLFGDPAPRRMETQGCPPAAQGGC